MALYIWQFRTNTEGLQKQQAAKSDIISEIGDPNTA